MQKQIRDAVIDAVKLAREAYPNYTIRMPEIKYSNRMTSCAGKAIMHQLRNPIVKFSLPIIRDNDLNDFIQRTVYHEVAHVVEFECFGTSGHGARFKHIQGTIFGKDNSRCHEFNTQPRKKRSGSVMYKCNNCNTEMELGAVRHKKQQHNRSIGGRGYTHKNCGVLGTLTQVT